MERQLFLFSIYALLETYKIRNVDFRDQLKENLDFNLFNSPFYTL